MQNTRKILGFLNLLNLYILFEFVHCAIKFNLLKKNKAVFTSLTLEFNFAEASMKLECVLFAKVWPSSSSTSLSSSKSLLFPTMIIGAGSESFIEFICSIMEEISLNVDVEFME
ncbi:hypothetical protein BpHYR1_035123 [Brachionus plicatilis]|uniref:Uncharacterized protein n=1 Tax=Brachionus plicatilis TaxID=10195 RepID=A0A3M7RJ23_BRAPC|nr:hypothetical protein BpHYR1_035123 [Brachionus plicatilis]